MADKSSIEWTEATWNPTTGCDRTSPGCDHCYALTMARRLKPRGNPQYQSAGDPTTSGPGFGITAHPDQLALPHGWKAPRTIFVNSMSDLFHPKIPDDFIEKVFKVMEEPRPQQFRRPAHTASHLPRHPATTSQGTGETQFCIVPSGSRSHPPDE